MVHYRETTLGMSELLSLLVPVISDALQKGVRSMLEAMHDELPPALRPCASSLLQVGRRGMGTIFLALAQAS